MTEDENCKSLLSFHNAKLRIKSKRSFTFKIHLTIIKEGRRVNQQVQNYKTCLKNSHLGVEKFNFSLGLSFNFFCIDIILLSV